MLLVCFSINIIAQTTNTRNWPKSERDSMETAFTMFNEEKFSQALPLYENLYNRHPEEVFLKYCYGKCALQRIGKYEIALKLLTDVYSKNNKIEDIELDLAKANHYNYKFDEAISLIEKCLVNKTSTTDTKLKAIQLKQNCINAKQLFANPTNAKINNIGNVINTNNDECMPLISADQSMLIFANEKYGVQMQQSFLTDGIFQSNFGTDGWMPSSSIDAMLNGKSATVGLSPDGNTLFINMYTSDDKGDIYTSNLVNGNWTNPQKLNGQVNSNFYEGSCSISADGKTLYFSSDRMGGKGGKDIYSATFMSDGTWGNVVNLGDSINTEFDEDAPFIHADGSTLFYSSKGRNSMGGYDIFQSTFFNTQFTKSINVGHPVNTPDDDIYYVMSANGVGYLASCKSGGYGLKDIYSVDMGYVGKQPSVYVVKGKITENGNPIAASIDVDNITQNNKWGSFIANSNGNYVIMLPSEGQFKLSYKYGSYTDKTINFNTVGLEGYSEKVNNIEFHKEINSNTINPKNDSLVKPGSILRESTRLYSLKYGDITAEGLVFKVQIAAYKHPKKNVHKALKKLGKIDKFSLEDGITRFTIGKDYNNLKGANEFCEKVIANGEEEAFVAILYKGKKVFLEDLEKMGIFVEKK